MLKKLFIPLMAFFILNIIPSYAIVWCNCNACDSRLCACPASCDADVDGCQVGGGNHCCSATGSYTCVTYYAISKPNNCGFSTTTVSNCGSGLTSSYCAITTFYADKACSSSNPFSCASATRTASCGDNTVCGKCAGGADTCGTAACGDIYGCGAAPKVCNGQGTGAGNCATPDNGATCYCDAMCTGGYTCVSNTCTAPTSTPTWSNMGSNVTNNTAVATGAVINISAKWTQVGGTLSYYILSNKTNTSGSFANSTWTAFSGGNWSNITFTFPSQQGSNITLKIYANGTSNLQNVTDTWYWWNVSAPSDTCTYSGSGNWFININDNCTLSIANTISGNMSIYGSNGYLIFGANQYAHGYYYNVSSLGTWYYNNFRWLY